MSRQYRLGLGALLEDELRRSKLQHTIVIHIRAMHSILTAKKRPTRKHFLDHPFTTVAGYSAIGPCPPLPLKPDVARTEGHKHGVHIVGAKKPTKVWCNSCLCHAHSGYRASAHLTLYTDPCLCRRSALPVPSYWVSILSTLPLVMTPCRCVLGQSHSSACACAVLMIPVVVIAAGRRRCWTAAWVWWACSGCSSASAGSESVARWPPLVL